MQLSRSILHQLFWALLEGAGWLRELVMGSWAFHPGSIVIIWNTPGVNAMAAPSAACSLISLWPPDNSCTRSTESTTESPGTDTWHQQKSWKAKKSPGEILMAFKISKGKCFSKELEWKWSVATFHLSVVLANLVGLKLLEITQNIRQCKFCVPSTLGRIHTCTHGYTCPSVTTQNLQLLWHSSNLRRVVCHHHNDKHSDLFSDLSTAFFEGFQGFTPCSDLCVSLCSLSLLLHHIHLHSQGNKLNCKVFAEWKFQNTEHHCSCSNRLSNMERLTVNNYQK